MLLSWKFVRYFVYIRFHDVVPRNIKEIAMLED